MTMMSCCLVVALYGLAVGVVLLVAEAVKRRRRREDLADTEQVRSAAHVDAPDAGSSRHGALMCPTCGAEVQSGFLERFEEAQAPCYHCSALWPYPTDGEVEAYVARLGARRTGRGAGR